MKIKVLEYYIRNIVDKAATGFERIDSSLEKVRLWIKHNQTALHATEESFNGRKSSSFWQASLLFYFKKLGRVWWLMPVIPALWKIEVGESPWAGSSRPAWPRWCDPVSTKNTKISWVWWHTPVVPATGEAEAGESLEPGRRWLQ